MSRGYSSVPKDIMSENDCGKSIYMSDVIVPYC